MAWKRTMSCSIFFAISFEAGFPAQAAGCINGHPSIEQEFQSAAFVMLGRVTAIKKNVPVSLPYKTGTYRSRIMIQTVAIAKQFKGPSRKTMTYNDEYSSAQFPMKKGQEYILFYRKRDDGELFIDVCGNSQETSAISKSLLKRIDQLSHNARYRAQ